MSELFFKCCQNGCNLYNKRKSLQREIYLLSSTPPSSHTCLAEPCLLSFWPLRVFGVQLVEVDYPR